MKYTLERPDGIETWFLWDEKMEYLLCVGKLNIMEYLKEKDGDKQAEALKAREAEYERQKGGDYNATSKGRI